MDVACACFAGKPSFVKAATAMIPPPAPRSPFKTPDDSPTAINLPVKKMVDTPDIYCYCCCSYWIVFRKLPFLCNNKSCAFLTHRTTSVFTL